MIKCSRTAPFSDLALVMRREPVRVKSEYAHPFTGRALAGKKRTWRIVRMCCPFQNFDRRTTDLAEFPGLAMRRVTPGAGQRDADERRTDRQPAAF